jgi:hypothetical protein
MDPIPNANRPVASFDPPQTEGTDHMTLHPHLHRLRAGLLGLIAGGLVAGLALLPAAGPAGAAASRAHGSFGNLYLDGQVVRTFGTPVSFPGQGIDPIYTFASGVANQYSVTAVGPGTGDFHGGAWQVYDVTWNVSPYLITSDEQLFAAASAGDVTITRDAAADFRCPVLP